MRLRFVAALIALLAIAGCHRPGAPAAIAAIAYGNAIVMVSGDHQAAPAGATLEQPLVVQVNDADGNGLAGARVEFRGSGGASFYPATGLTGSDGQLAVKVQLGSMAGRNSLLAMSRDKTGGRFDLNGAATALGYQQVLGRELAEQHCARCHDSRSTAERVSNHDNLGVTPHSLDDGLATNSLGTADLVAIIAHGGAAIGRSPEMPPYSPTLSVSEIDALAAWIRIVAVPAYGKP